MTKDEYNKAIDEARVKRREALAEITTLTLAPFDISAVLKQAQIAQDAYEEIRMLKTEMREQYPHKCVCTCGKYVGENDE